VWGEVVCEKEPARAVLGILDPVQQREEEGVVQDDDLGGRDAAAERLVETAAGGAAGFRRAKVLLAADLFPDGGVGLLEEIAERAVARGEAPLADALEFGVLDRREEVLRLREGAGEAGGAEEIVAALQQDGLELARHDFLHERNVLEHELLLQGDGVGRDDRLALRAERVEHGGDKVGEGFPDARARLDDDVGAAFQRSGNGARHALLLGAVFERCGAREDARLGKDGLDLELERRRGAEFGIVAERNHRARLLENAARVQPNLAGQPLGEYSVNFEACRAKVSMSPLRRNQNGMAPLRPDVERFEPRMPSASTRPATAPASKPPAR